MIRKVKSVKLKKYFVEDGILPRQDVWFVREFLFMIKKYVRVVDLGIRYDSISIGLLLYNVQNINWRVNYKLCSNLFI